MTISKEGFERAINACVGVHERSRRVADFDERVKYDAGFAAYAFEIIRPNLSPWQIDKLRDSILSGVQLPDDFWTRK